MSASPFEIFRRHQILTVVLIGLAMLSFVIFGAVQDPGNIPAGLWIFALAFIVGGVAWISGLQKQRQNEWGVIGLAGGAVLGMAFARLVQPAASVDMIGGGMTENEILAQVQDRNLTNDFVRRVYEYSMPEGSRPLNGDLLFGFSDGRGQMDSSRQATVDWEILLREADRLGIEVSDETVNEYLKAVTDQNVTQKAVQRAAADTRRSVVATYESLKKHLAANVARRHLVYEPDMTPVDYYDFYRRMNEERQIDAVRVPVSAFTDRVEEPDEGALLAMFDQYRLNQENIGPDGRFEGGRPGFFQPPQVQIAAVEFRLEDLKSQVEEPTEEELREAYEAERQFDLPQAPPMNDLSIPDLPGGPALGTPDGDADAEMTEEDAVEEMDLSAPALPVKEDGEDKPAEGKPAEETPSEEKPAEGDKPAEDETGTSSLWPRPATYTAAFQEEDTPAVREKAPAAGPTRGDSKPPAGDKPADDKPAETAQPAPMPANEAGEDKPNADKPAEEMKSEDKPSDDKPADDGDKPEMTGDATPPPAPEAPDAADEPPKPPTFEERKDELREQIVERRAVELQREKVAEGSRLLVDLKSRMSGEDGLTPDAVNEEMKTWAEANGGVFMVTPMDAADDLIEAKEPPVAAAEVRTRQGVVQVPYIAAIGLTEGREFEAYTADNFETDSAFVWWKVDGKPAFPPESLEEEGVREQVLEAYRKQEARPMAEKRAEEIAELIREQATAEKTVDEVVEGVTLTEGGEPLEVKTTPLFTWLVSNSANTNPFNDQRRAFDLNDALESEDEFSDEFMEAVFRETPAGGVSVVPTADKDAYWVIRVRENATDLKDETFLQKYAESSDLYFLPPFFGGPYQQLSQFKRRQTVEQPMQTLERAYEVQIAPEPTF